MTKYKLIVKLPDVTLTFHFNKYEIIDNCFYRFFDAKTQTYRVFDSRICDLVENVEENE